MIDWSILLSHETSPAVQFIKYAVAGGIATATSVVLFHLLGWRIFPCLTARDPFVRLLHLQIQETDDRRRSRNAMRSNGVSFIFSNMVAYGLNVLFVFRAGRHPWPIELLLFYLVSGVSLVTGTALMGWLIRRFGMLTTIAFGANLVTALMINYAMRRYVIFNG